LTAPPATARRRTVTIINRKGLHARAAARFCKLAATFESDVWVARGGQTVSGCSIMGLMMLAAAPGCAVDIAAAGPDADRAVSALCKLVEDGFEEED